MSKPQGQGDNFERRKYLLSSLQWASAPCLWASASQSLAQSKKSVDSKSVKSAAQVVVQPEKRSFSIACANPAALPYLPLLVAQKLGYFAAQGLELEINEQQSMARAIQAVGAGQADAVCGWLENLLAPQGRALGLQSFVLLGLSPMMALCAPVKPAIGAPVSTLVQLRGRKIGVVALNSPTHTVAMLALRRAGLRASDVGFVSVGSPASALTSLRSGQIDALIHMDPLMLQLEFKSEVTLLADLRSPELAERALGMSLPSSCLATTPDFLQRFPGTAQAATDAMVLALQWLTQASFRDVLQLLPENLPSSVGGMDAQMFVASFERLRSAFSTDGFCQPQWSQQLLQALYEVDPALRLDRIDPQRSIQNALVLRSKQRMKIN
jgi:NitT/TauT family transport system substrate-binding protein